MIFSLDFFFYRGSSGGVATTRGNNSHGLTGHLRVSCEWSGTGMQGTAFLSTLMESGMVITSCMIVLVMCCGKGT